MSTIKMKNDVRHLVGKLFNFAGFGSATDGDVRVGGKILWTVMTISGTKRRGGPGPKNYGVEFGTDEYEGEPELTLSVPAWKPFKSRKEAEALRERYTDNLVRGIEELQARRG